LSPRPQERVLDLCCGTGDLALECLRQQPRCRVVGADFAIPMLRLAAQKSTARGKTLPLFSGDALHLPFIDNAFDALTVGFGVRNFEDTAAGLREMARVVKPGGRILVLEFMRPNMPPLLQQAFEWFSRWVMPRVGALLSRHTGAYSYLPASVQGFYSRREFEKLLRQIGCGNVRSFDLSFGIATVFIAHKL
jgi:demethylmenaquinone methyltransferase/2-methoxy-6-polyprenyl-1,4-benzoquinol methylase